MYNNIAFIGGIHGVGKSTVCKAICEAIGFEHLTASDVLKWKELQSSAEKNVADISQTQDRLIIGLNAIVNKSKRYLLDGHFCLLTKLGTIEKVPVETFKQIAPFSLSVIIGDISVIKERLEKRDGRPYDWNLLNEMQECEVFHAKQVADILKINLNICTSDNPTDIIETLKR